jgi:hypothetical protein
MAANLCGKKVKTHQNDEVRYVFTPTEHSYNINLKNIFVWTSFRVEEKAWANKARLVGLFEVEWKTPCHNILVEFLNNWKRILNITKSRSCWGKNKEFIDKHLLTKVLKIYHIGETEANHVEMSDAKVELVDIADRVLDIYNTNER